MEGKKIIIPIHSSKSRLQLAYASKLQQIFNILGHHVSIINLDASDDLWYVQNYILNEKADLLVTIDCSGFELKLLGDDLFYNSLCIPAMHFLTRRPWEFESELSERMNFTMEFYVMNDGDKRYIEENCWRVPCVHRLPECFDLEEIKELAEGKKQLDEYVPSKKILNEIKELPKVFESIFENAVERIKADRDVNTWEILEAYLKALNFDASEEEKEELFVFVEWGKCYVESFEMEKMIFFIYNEFHRLLE